MIQYAAVRLAFELALTCLALTSDLAIPTNVLDQLFTMERKICVIRCSQLKELHHPNSWSSNRHERTTTAKLERRAVRLASLRSGSIAANTIDHMLNRNR